MLRVRLLGQFDVHLDERRIEIPSRQAQLLFAYLVLHPGIEHHRQKLAGLLWPEMSDLRARNNLRHALWRIRKALGVNAESEDSILCVDDQTITFEPRGGYWLDTEVLNTTHASASAQELIHAVRLYKDELLPGMYEEWVVLERERFRALLEQKLQFLLDRLIQDQRWDDVLQWSEHWIALGQVPEPAFRALMVAYRQRGEISNVIATFQRCSKALRKDLDAAPSLPTQDLYARLLRGDPNPVVRKMERAAFPVPSERSTSEPPATNSPAIVNWSPLRVHNEPAQPTLFINRAEELATIAALLRDPTCRLLTVMGLGGVGKTRLCLQAASREADSFRDGVYYVPLGECPGAEFLDAAITDALGYSFHGHQEPRLQLLNFVQDKQLLLVLDGFEHLLEGEELIEFLLTHSTHVKLLVSSRERLHSQWEWLLEIEGLDYPQEISAQNNTSYGAVQLFIQAAQRVNARFSPGTELPAIANICRRVQGIPLAIELAAAWTRSLSCREIAHRLESSFDFLSSATNGVPERQQSLRATFEYSWKLLSVEEKNVLRKLSVFRGGFRRDAAAQVAGASASHLFGLVDKSLLRRAIADRYEMHELLRQFVAEKSGKGSNASLKLAHYYLGYARQHKGSYTDLQVEWNNLITGMQVAYERQLWEVVIEYGEILAETAFSHGRFSDALHAYRWASDAARALSDQRAAT